MFVSAEDGSYLVEVTQGVLRFLFNRPDFGNAVPTAAVPGLTALFQAAQADPTIRTILVRGEGKDILRGRRRRRVQALACAIGRRAPGRLRRTSATRAQARRSGDGLRPAYRGVDPRAAAGAGLLYPLAADLVIGDPTAAFVFAHRNMALIPDGGITLLLPKVVGERTARMLTLTGARLEAEEALLMGILHRIVAADQLEDEALQAAVRLARAPQVAIRLTKQMLLAAPRRTPGEILDAETAGIVQCVGDDDFAEAVGAFMDKRPALRFHRPSRLRQRERRTAR